MDDLKQPEELKEQFQAVPFPAGPETYLPTSHDLVSPQEKFDKKVKDLMKCRKKSTYLDPKMSDQLQELVRIDGARIRKSHFNRPIMQKDLEILHFLLRLARHKIVRKLAAQKKQNRLIDLLEGTPGDDPNLPKIIIHLLDCGVKIDRRTLLIIFVQTPELAAQLAQHKLDFNFDMALDLCVLNDPVWTGRELLYLHAFEAFLQYCCPCQSLTWIVRNHHLKLETEQALRMISTLIPRYLVSPNIKRYELGYYGIVRVCLTVSRLDLAVFMLLRGAPVIKFHWFHRKSGPIEQAFVDFQEQIYTKICMFMNVDSREPEFGVLTMFPKEIVQLILLFMFKTFTSLTDESEQLRDSFKLFHNVLTT